MFQRIRNMLVRVPKLNPFWDQAVIKRTQHTPDLINIAGMEAHLLFVYDGMKIGFPDQDVITNSKFMSPGMTQDDNLVLWKKDYRHGNPVAIAAITSKPSPNSKRFDPRNPDPSRLRGEIHLVSPEVIFNLDEMMANGLYFERKRIQIQLPWSPNKTRKVRGMWVPDEFPEYVETHAYLTTTEVIGDEPWYTLSPASKFQPQQRHNNSRYISNKAYYEFTKRDLNGVRK